MSSGRGQSREEAFTYKMYRGSRETHPEAASTESIAQRARQTRPADQGEGARKDARRGETPRLEDPVAGCIDKHKTTYMALKFFVHVGCDQACLACLFCI